MKVVVEFLSRAAGGRKSLEQLKLGAYRPHFLVGSGRPLGVEFEPEPSRQFVAGEPTVVEVRLIYTATEDYSALAVGVEFSIIEGPRVVGSGRVVAL